MTDAAPQLIVKTFPVGHLQCNCTVIGDPVTKQAIVVDPGGDSEKILGVLAENGLSVSQILHTHAHFDHFLASGRMKEATGASLCLHRADKPLWDIVDQQCAMFGFPCDPIPDPDHWLAHEEDITLAGLKGQAIHTPGHTPGSMSFSFPELKLLVAGDTLFRGSIGRTDLWGGDTDAIQRSIQQRLYTLDEETAVVTGHGPSTSIGFEMRNNMYVRA